MSTGGPLPLGYSLDPVTKKLNINQVIDMYIEKVTVYPDKIEVCFNLFPKLTVNLDERQEDCENSQSSAVEYGGVGRPKYELYMLRWRFRAVD